MGLAGEQLGPSWEVLVTPGQRWSHRIGVRISCNPRPPPADFRGKTKLVA